MVHYCVKQLTGKYKYMSEQELREIKAAQLELLALVEGQIHVDEEYAKNLPLWREVEFLERIIEFEMENNPDLLSFWIGEEPSTTH